MIEEIEGRGVGNLIQFYGGRLRVDILAQLYSIIDRRFFRNISYIFFIHLFREMLSEKARDKTENWSGIHWILYPGLEEMYKFVFLQVKNLFLLSIGIYLKPYFYCRMSLSLEKFF